MGFIERSGLGCWIRTISHVAKNGIIIKKIPLKFLWTRAHIQFDVSGVVPEVMKTYDM